jgi:hypothetical protein
MGKAFLLCAFLSAALAIVAYHYHHISLSVILLCFSIMSTACGLVLFKSHPLADLLEDMRRHAD